MPGRRNGMDRGDRDRFNRRAVSLGTALNRNTKSALNKHGQGWHGRMVKRFRAPLVPYGQVNTNTTLHNRTGFLRNSLNWRVLGTRLDDLALELRSDSPYARLQEYGGVVRARRSGGYLAIPIDDNLTPAGATRWPSPTNPEISDGFFLDLGRERLYYVRRKRTTNRRTQREEQDLQFLFAMRKEVDIPGPGPRARRKMKSRLGFRREAVGPDARSSLRRRLVVSARRSIAEAFPGARGGS